MKSPDYTMRDLVFYTGLFGGIIGTVTLMKSQGTPHIINLLLGGVVGLGIGLLGQRMYDQTQRSSSEARDAFRQLDDDDERF